ncbi:MULTISPECIES: isochorismate synthase [Halorubrum]|uniref:isochorismate synthase n=1 Tax=Halorubrum sodomense TaxID=35743 RepID=A0A1I6HCE9_HALSD|nr:MULTISPECIES: isochorismate synthase [Halorubrum]TKX55885.1 isochorismate synthase [Halorubrum sp. SP3]TKX71330.1 isochorismate synthase [Halorubrum sp. SP9]SFR52123.1 isochorismate synthase [Halorubrum sodomense]
MDQARSRSSPPLVSRTTAVDEPGFAAAFDALSAPRTVWSAPDDALVIGGGAAATLTAAGSDRFASIREAATELFEAGDVHAGTEAARPRVFGGFAFHEGACDGDPWGPFPEARFVLPRTQLTVADNGTWLTVNAVGADADAAAVEDRLAREVERFAALGDADHGAVDGSAARSPRPGISESRRTTSREAWRESVGAAVDRIRDGDLRKVVLAQALEADLAADFPRAATLERLAEKYPDCHRYWFEPAAGESAFFGATPERLVSLRGRTVETDALAGTTGRGETPTEDEWLARELLDDEKNVHEHELVAETVRHQLEPFAASVSAGERRVRRLATVQHLHTPITAELDADRHVLDLVEALHPTPAVGGLPPDRALATIRETEPFDRGWYAAPVGWIDAAGNGAFAVAIRSAVASRRRATLFAGVGIVSDSDPDREWDEVQLKYRPILDELEADAGVDSAD